MAKSSVAGARRRGEGRGRGWGRGRGQQKEEVDYDFQETAQFVVGIPHGMVSHRCLGRLRRIERNAPQTIDIAFLTDIRSIGLVREFMLATSPWARLFEVGRERAHREITLEFLSTFAFTETWGWGLRHFLETPTVSFTLSGSLAQGHSHRLLLPWGCTHMMSQYPRHFWMHRPPCLLVCYGPGEALLVSGNSRHCVRDPRRHGCHAFTIHCIDTYIGVLR
ncbi:hypothetical protein Hanom_Chr01g00036721 [Helianthus anomalus]